MKPLFVLVGTFGIALLITIFTGGIDYTLSGRIAMAVMLAFTALGHFLYARGMAMMLPDAIPFRKGLVYLTGLIEVAAAIGLLIPGMETTTGWLLILFFVLMLPANIYAAIKRVDYQKATYEGPGRNYLWFRVPLQVLFILWTYFSAIK